MSPTLRDALNSGGKAALNTTLALLGSTEFASHRLTIKQLTAAALLAFITKGLWKLLEKQLPPTSTPPPDATVANDHLNR